MIVLEYVKGDHKKEKFKMATQVTNRFWRAYKDHPDQWEEVSQDYVLEYLDGPYRDPHAALDYLIESGTITTPFAIYRSQPV